MAGYEDVEFASPHRCCGNASEQFSQNTYWVLGGPSDPLRGWEESLCDQVECDRKEQGRKVEVGWDQCP